MVIVVISVKKSILLLSNAKVRGILVSFPMSEGAVKFGILPVNRKDSFTFKLFTED
jgi:hypothetical protein